jgi:hypothetical protein
MVMGAGGVVTISCDVRLEAIVMNSSCIGLGLGLGLGSKMD